jgi:hypothetical protein
VSFLVASSFGGLRKDQVADRRPKQGEIEMGQGQGAWAQRGLVPAWEGEVVHPGAPGRSHSARVYWQDGRTQFYRVLSAFTLRNIQY